MRKESGLPVDTLRVDGGPTASRYLMQFKRDIANVTVQIPDLQELSGMGAAYTAGMATELYRIPDVFHMICYQSYRSDMITAKQTQLLTGWYSAIRQALRKSN